MTTESTTVNGKQCEKCCSLAGHKTSALNYRLKYDNKNVDIQSYLTFGDLHNSESRQQSTRLVVLHNNAQVQQCYKSQHDNDQEVVSRSA